MSRVRRNAGPLLALVALAVLAAVGFLLPPPSNDDGPGGTSVLRRFLAEAGVDVRRAEEPGEPGETFFLPHDLRSRAEANALLEWVRSGGRVVVADPRSAVLTGAGLRMSGAAVGGFVPQQQLTVDCVLPAATGVRAIVTAPSDATFEAGPAEALGCFAAGGGTFLALRSYGEGEVIGLGGVTPLTNEHLRDADDARLAWNLLGGGAVAFGSPALPGSSASGGLWDLLPATARAVILQLAIALAVYALVRARRLGPPVEERLPAPIPASELVGAIAELYRRSRSWQHAGSLLERRFRQRVARRLGIEGVSSEELASAVDEALGSGAEASGRPRAVTDERSLVAVARSIERTERRLEGDET